jgi:predicted MPP superfamily phosphohydrolase
MRVGKILAGIALAAVAGLAWATLVERRAYTLRRHRVAVLEPGSSPVRVLHISDLHLAPWQADKIAWIAALADLNVDLVIDTGDNLGHENALPALRRALAPFAGTPGVFVHGSNDYWAPELKNPARYLKGPSQAPEAPRALDTAALTEFLSNDLGWTNLNNTAARVEIAGQQLEFMGVDDPHRGYDSLPEMSRALDDLQSEQSLGVEEEELPTPVVLVGVAHAPYQRILNAFVTRGASMIFAGHTHGGQLCIPGFGALVTNCDIPRKQVSGLSAWWHGERVAALNVSAGLGTSIYAPARFACPPEVSLIELVARENE